MINIKSQKIRALAIFIWILNFYASIILFASVKSLIVYSHDDFLRIW